jgi:hypothetical protein
LTKRRCGAKAAGTGEECVCVQKGSKIAREEGCVGDMVGLEDGLLESHIRGLGAGCASKAI